MTNLSRTSLVKYAWLAVATAVLTIGMKAIAYWITGSIGLFSDALEGLVNLVAAILVLVTLKIVERPPDSEHEYGHDKASYFSSGVEGSLILVAAASITVTSIQRMFNPQPLEQTGIGLVIAGTAGLINLVVGQTLIRVGKRHESIALEADGHHLMADVWTSAGVIAGVAAAVWSGQGWLDPAVALVMAAKIAWDGLRIVRRSVRGLMDSSLEQEELDRLIAVLDSYSQQGIRWHALRTRQAGARRFIGVHILVPGNWSMQHAHDLVEEVEANLRGAVANAIIFTHLEPIGDPAAEQDLSLEGKDVANR